MSTFSIEFGPEAFLFEVAHSESERRTKISMAQSNDKIGTVLLEDLARTGLPRGLVVVATLDSGSANCEVSTSGELQVEGETFELPAYLQINDDGVVEILKSTGFTNTKILG